MIFSNRPLRPSLIAFIFLGLALASAHAASTKTAEQAGANLFREKGCEYCHGAGAAGAKKGPPLVGSDFYKSWTSEKIKTQLMMGGKKMPSFSDALSDEEILNLIAYLRSRHRPIPNIAPPPPGAQQ